MVTWNYDASDYAEMSLIPEGMYRVRIEEVSERKSSTGKNMIELVLKVSGQRSKLWNYIVLDDSSDDAKKRTNQRLGQVFDSFGITPNDFNFLHWEGKTGGACIKHRKNKDNPDDIRANVSYFIKRDKLNTLPDWQEMQKQGGKIEPEMVKFDDDIPF